MACDHSDTRVDWSMPKGFVFVWRRCSRCGASLEAHFGDQHDDPPAVHAARPAKPAA